MISPVSISVGAAHVFANSIISEKSFLDPDSPSMCLHPAKPAAPVVNILSL